MMTTDVAALVEPLWQEVASYLEREKQRIFDEILHYPPPIPACDVQFNHLLAQRAEMMRELQRLRAIAAGELLSLREFIETCPFLDASGQAQLLAEVDGVLHE